MVSDVLVGKSKDVIGLYLHDRPVKFDELLRSRLLSKQPSRPTKDKAEGLGVMKVVRGLYAQFRDVRLLKAVRSSRVSAHPSSSIDMRGAVFGKVSVSSGLL
jgi:hypothetical protein